MIISYDRISDWINKGAYVNRYFNPGDLFDHIHFVLLNEEAPNQEAVQKMAGRARFTLHTFPTGIPLFVKTLGWYPPLLRNWSKKIVQLASEVKPQLIRCHWGFLNGFIAREIKRTLGVPYAVSLHINLDEDVRPYYDLGRKIRDLAFQRFERQVLQDADVILPVYKPILPYLKRHGISRYEVAYNVINPEYITRKFDTILHSPVRIVCVGRQIPLKNPTPLIQAVARIPETQLTLIGNGSLHSELRTFVERLGISDRVEFKKDIPNDQVVKELADYDIYAAHSEHWELSKTLIEAFLTGLPVLINRRKGLQVPELNSEICEFVENTPEGYELGLKRLINNPSRREALAKQAVETATLNWSPDVCENRFKAIYERLLGTLNLSLPSAR